MDPLGVLRDAALFHIDLNLHQAYWGCPGSFTELPTTNRPPHDSTPDHEAILVMSPPAARFHAFVHTDPAFR